MYLFSISRRDRKCGFFGKLIFCIALLVMAATEAKAVSYTAFNGNTYELTPWEGTNVVVLTQSNVLDVSTMSNIVENLDGAWDVYEDLTGRSPTPWTATTLNGLSTIAEVPDGETCGAGCAFLGFTGIEIASPFWNILYDGVMSANEYDQVLFYELGRNFWLYSEQLGAIEPFVTGFAIANRFVSMNEIDVAGGPFGSFTFDEFKRLATEELFAAYLADPSLDWRNTLAANSGVPGEVFSGAADLGGAILHRIYEDHGYEGYRAFWRELNDQPQATTSEDAMVNFIYAAYLGTGQDYRPLLKADDLPAPVFSEPSAPAPTIASVKDQMVALKTASFSQVSDYPTRLTANARLVQAIGYYNIATANFKLGNTSTANKFFNLAIALLTKFKETLERGVRLNKFPESEVLPLLNEADLIIMNIEQLMNPPTVPG